MHQSLPTGYDGTRLPKITLLGQSLATFGGDCVAERRGAGADRRVQEDTDQT